MARPSGTGSPTPSASSRTRRRPVRYTENPISHSEAGLIDRLPTKDLPDPHLTNDNVLSHR